MAITAIIFGLVMDLMGIGAFVATGAVTALIPSVFGTLIFVCGILALLRKEWRKHAMHVAAVTAALGFVGAGIRALPKIPQLLAGAPVEPSATAIWMQLVFALLCLVFFIFCFASFLRARAGSGQNS